MPNITSEHVYVVNRVKHPEHLTVCMGNLVCHIVRVGHQWGCSMPVRETLATALMEPVKPFSDQNSTLVLAGARLHEAGTI